MIDRGWTRLLTVVPGPIFPDRSGGDRRLVALLELLQRSSDLDIYQEDEVTKSGRRPFQPARGRVLVSGWREVTGAFLYRRYTGVLIELWRVAERTLKTARSRQPWVACVVDSVDVHFLREESAASLGLLPADVVARNKERELAVYAGADAVVVVTPEEQHALEAEGIQTPILVIPIIIPLRDRPVLQRTPEVLFVGGFQHSPNVDGIRWFVEKCWDAVRGGVPDARLAIVGSGATAEVLELGKVPGVEVHGYVADTEVYLDRAAVSIAPLRYGGGMKGKVCEALASGVPVVTTSVGAQGIPLVEGASARIADTAWEFAGAVVWALQCPEAAEAMGKRGQEEIARLCGMQAVLPKVQRLVDVLNDGPRAAWGEMAKWWLAAGWFHLILAARRGLAFAGGRKLYRWWRRSRVATSGVIQGLDR